MKHQWEIEIAISAIVGGLLSMAVQCAIPPGDPSVDWALGQGVVISALLLGYVALEAAARVPAPDWATHKGWLGLCPVWLNLSDDDGPVVEPRFRSFAWLMPVSRAVFGVCFTVRTAFDRDYVPAWPLRITGVVHTRAGDE